MHWRKGLRYASILLLLVTLVTGFAWLVLLGYGEDATASIFLVIAGVALVIGGVLMQLSRIETTSVHDGAEPRYTKRVTYPDGTTRTVTGHPLEVQMEERPVEAPMGNSSPLPDMFPVEVWDLPPPRGQVVSDEVRYYPALDRTDMTVEEYDRWTDGVGPVEGEWEETEARHRREKYRDFRR
jgi:hypothetical protein